MAEKIKRTVTRASARKAVKYMKKDPEKSMPRLMKWADRIDYTGAFENHRNAFRGAIEDPENNWHQLLKRVWTDVDEGVRARLFENFIINACLEGLTQQRENEKKYHCNIPWALLISPTTDCNLHCKGCWAANYKKQTNLSLESMDYIIRQAKELGTYMFIFTGGEPLMRKDDIIKLCELHSDAVFLAFTNGVLIDNDFAYEMLRVKNFVPAISIEGYEDENDFRRGKGTYAQIIGAFDILRKKKLPFGVSCCYTNKNAELIGSEKFFDFLVAQNAFFAWLFLYMPIGNHADTSLMVSAEQREYMYNQVRKFRKTKPLFTMDFWNDGDSVGGCIAAARRYFHIAASGDIEPCAFVHYSDSNIHQKTLLQAYKSPLFMEYRKNQPFNENLLRPCPILDNHGMLAEMVDWSNAKSTDVASPEDVHAYCDKCRSAADEWAPVADRLWRQNPKNPMREEVRR